MKIEASRTGLLKAIQQVAAVLPTRSVMPIYQKVYLRADETNNSGDSPVLEVIGTDLEVSLRVLVECKIVDPGECVLPPDKLIAILRESKSDTVSIDATNGERAVIRCGGRYTIAIEDYANYSLPDFDVAGNWSFNLPAADLSELLRRVSFAVSRDEGKYALRSMLFTVNDGHITGVATDGKRMSIARLADSLSGFNLEGAVIALIPSKAVTILQQLAHSGDVSCRINDNLAGFKFDGATMVTRQAEGRFPPYGNVIPRNFRTNIEIEVGQFLAAIRQAAIMTDQESRRVELIFESGKCRISSQSAEVGESDIVCDVPGYDEPEPLKIMFDWSYLVDFLKLHEPGDVVTLQIVDPKKAVYWRVSDSWGYMLVPLIRRIC